MLRKFALALVLMLFCCHVATGQEIITIGPAPTQAEKATADKVNKLEKAKESPKKMLVGGYKLAEIDTTNKLKWYIIGKDVLVKVFIPKGTEYTGWLIAEGETERKLVTIPASTKDRYLLLAAMQGSTTLILITNGATLNDEPVVVDAFQFQIGEPEPDKPPVILDALVKLAQADAKAGNGTLDQAAKYREFLRAASTSLMSSVRLELGRYVDMPGQPSPFPTMGEFYTSLHDGAERLIGKADVSLPTMRAEIARIFKADIGGNMGDPFPPETRAKVATILSGVASRLDGLK